MSSALKRPAKEIFAWTKRKKHTIVTPPQNVDPKGTSTVAIGALRVATIEAMKGWKDLPTGETPAPKRATIVTQYGDRKRSATVMEAMTAANTQPREMQDVDLKIKSTVAIQARSVETIQAMNDPKQKGSIFS
jgi:hypothetical protein